MKKFRNSTFCKIIWGFLALQLLNISIDSPDPHPNYIPEDLTFNDQESIVEFVAETLLGYEDFIEEYDDNDLNEETNKKTYNLNWIATCFKASTNLNRYFLYKVKLAIPYEKNFSQPYLKIVSPPPEV